MILVDANLLIYARIADFDEHEAAREWLDERLNGRTGVALPWPSLLAFSRLVTNPRIFVNPLSMKEAWAQIGEWLDLSVVWTPPTTDRHRETLGRLLEQIGGKANLVPDAHLAALAIEYGLTLCSTDGDFARFEGLQWENPLRTRA